jgi:hypothetical protein
MLWGSPYDPVRGNGFREGRAVVIPVDYPALLDTNTGILCRFRGYRQAMEDLMDGKNNRFEIFGLRARRKSIAVHETCTSPFWSFSI